MNEDALYADVVLPLSFGDTLTYRVGDGLRPLICPGARVEVPLGANRIYTGIVVRLHGDRPEGFEIKSIASLLDETPLLTGDQLKLWRWMADYYLCTPGEVMNAALPAGLKEADAYRPKTKVMLQPDPSFDRSLLGRAARQREVLDALTLLTEAGPIERKTFLEARPDAAAALTVLCARGAVSSFSQQVSRIDEDDVATSELHPLTAPQQAAFQAIKAAWESKDVCLLHGVTSSGKTEIYIHLMQECIEQGKQVLFLLPEIALTTQMTARLKSFFGQRLGVYHSAYSPAERVEIWNKVREDKGYQIIVGARSAVFLPFTRLGLVIVDEEHETSYKQQEPAPRYHARNTALVLAKMQGAKALLGTATPSFESYTKAREGKYGLVELTQRYRDMLMPAIQFANLRELRFRKEMKGIFSPLLLEKMSEAFASGRQVILFQNRRGYAPTVVCRQCGWVPRCRRCDVSLGFHRQSNRLRCHYCGKSYRLPESCPHCGGVLDIQGFGTEKIEEEVKKRFPDIRVARMDTDILQNRRQYEEVMEGFTSGRIDLLVGTQMLTKGLDFDNVHLVGILNADPMLCLPDFRAHERAFQMLTQVSGRSGRKGRQGCVIIQTGDPDDTVIRHVLSNDYDGLYAEEMQERALFSYPPYAYLIDIHLRHREQPTVIHAAETLVTWLSSLGEGVTAAGPCTPVVSRVNNLYLQKITLKISPSLPLKPIKAYLCQARQNLNRSSEFRNVHITFDVDPL